MQVPNPIEQHKIMIERWKTTRQRLLFLDEIGTEMESVGPSLERLLKELAINRSPTRETFGKFN